MRELHDHKVNGLNEAIKIAVLDEPGQGGACHKYEMRIGDVPNGKPTIAELEQILASNEPQSMNMHPDGGITTDVIQRISFQNGPVKEFGFNGVSQEALLTIVIDRLRSFQQGPFSCRDNACALTHCEEALMWLQKRTRDRMARGVEGENKQ